MIEKELKNLLLDYSAKFKLSAEEKEELKEMLQHTQRFNQQDKAAFWCDLNHRIFWENDPRVTRVLMDYIADQIGYTTCYTEWQKRYDLSR